MSEILYGKHSVLEALRARRRKVHRVLIAEPARGPQPAKEANERARREETAARHAEIESEARSAGVTVERVLPARLDALTRVGQHHQGVAAEVSAFKYDTLAETVERCREAGPDALVLVLDTLQDPQNFGTLLRTSEAVGVTAVVILDRRQVEVTPAVSNASAGAVEHMSVCLANNLARAIEELKETGMWVYALQAEPGAQTYTQADLRGALGLVVGSEGRGVGRLVRERCDGALEIPMRGRIESLNAAVAGSVVLYEALRQRTAS
ncbi:MAG TPA: 23S rRNA (guanosine(2251)-2'-O)-methyltransferase RlmB [Chloroflexia bacterium]|nr:23S rRNA (guanosine(2251)-2'-O)-methyltransferase RlmB [Chloroflexia bacterium]